jgi:hypothetical protein
VWEVNSYEALEALARDVGEKAAFRPAMAGVYRDFAEEIL